MEDVINKEEKPFGLCAPEVQEALRNAEANGYTVYVYTHDGWNDLGAPRFDGKRFAYKAVRKMRNLAEVVGDWSDAPEWAVCAAVDKDGEAYYYNSKPTGKNDCSWYWNWEAGIEHRQIHGKFDASDWQKSLIERPKKLRPWKLHEFMGKYIRVKGDPFFSLARMNYRDCTIDTAFSQMKTPEWWLDNGECLLPDGSFGPCGDEV
jgi:hypothetical protein